MKNTNILYDSAEKTPVVLPEMEELLPPLTEEQSSALEEDILNNGCYSPVIVNQNMVVVDGHNRKRLCEKHGIPYRMAVFEFESLLEAKQWALETQRGRRNLDKWELGKIALKLRPELEAKGRANQSAAGGDKSPEALLRNPTKALPERVNTRQQMAGSVGLSVDMMGRIMKIDRDAPKAVKKALDRKEISINQAYRIARKAKEIEEDRREEFAEAAIESIEKLRKSDAEADRRSDIAGMFCKAFEKAVLLVPSEENVGYWVACCLMDQRSIRLEIDNAEELSQTFATIAAILRKFLEEGVGFHPPKITQSANKEEQSA